MMHALRRLATIRPMLGLFILLCLFLPFFSISCNTEVLATVRAIDLMREVPSYAGGTELSVPINAVGTYTWIFVICVMFLTVAGLFKSRIIDTAGLVCSAIAFLCLIMVYQSISDMSSTKVDDSYNLTVRFLLGFYLIIVLTVIEVCLFGYALIRPVNSGEKSA